MFNPVIPEDKAFAVSLFSTDFENQDLAGWSSSGGGASATVCSESAKSGTYSLKIQNDKTSSYGYQLIIPNIEGGMFYQAFGFGKADNPSTAAYFIRVAWYSSMDGSGSQLSTPSDSNQGLDSGVWRELSTSSIQAPPSANSAKVRLVLTSKTTGTLASAFFDDIAFSEAVAPTLTPTETPTPTKSPTNTPTDKPTITPSPTISATPTINNFAASVSGILGQSTISAIINSPIPFKNNVQVRTLSAKDNSLIFKLIMAAGIVFILACVIVITYYRLKIHLND